MFPVCFIALLCLVSVGCAAPLDCKDLVRPLDQLDPHHLEGRWTMVAGSLSDPKFMEQIRLRDSATVSFSSNTSETNISFSPSMRAGDKCHYASFNISLKGSSFTIADGTINSTFTHTSCHDCILMSFEVNLAKHQHFYLFSRRRQVEQEEMEEFTAQVECLEMPPPAVMDPNKELCPEQMADDSQAQTDEKTERQEN